MHKTWLRRTGRVGVRGGSKEDRVVMLSMTPLRRWAIDFLRHASSDFYRREGFAVRCMREQGTHGVIKNNLLVPLNCCSYTVSYDRPLVRMEQRLENLCAQYAGTTIQEFLHEVFRTIRFEPSYLRYKYVVSIHAVLRPAVRIRCPACGWITFRPALFLSAIK